MEVEALKQVKMRLLGVIEAPTLNLKWEWELRQRLVDAHKANSAVTAPDGGYALREHNLKAAEAKRRLMVELGEKLKEGKLAAEEFVNGFENPPTPEEQI